MIDDATGNASYVIASPGVDGLREPAADLDCGNSGTSLRLFAGILAGLPFRSVLDGDDSLRRRPVARIIEPLRSMGAALHARSNDSLPPVTVIGRSPLQAVDVSTTVPSAQVKSAILLAALRADGRTTVRESVATRDHTERMLRARGVSVETVADGPGGGAAISLEGGSTVLAVSERVPGDVSAAAFWLVAGSIHPDAELTLRGVGVNPTRRAVIDILASMGADLTEVVERPDGRSGRRRRADRRHHDPLERAPCHRPGSARRRRGDRRDPGPVPGRRPRRRHDPHPGRRRAAPQGVGPDRRASRRASSRSARGSTSTATT